MDKKQETPPTTSTSPWENERNIRADREREKREALMAAAAVAFEKNGYHKTTIDDIARSLKISKPTFYNYYKKKEDLLHECTKTAYEHIMLSAEVAKNSSGTALEKLEVYFQQSLNFTTTELGRALAGLAEPPTRNASDNSNAYKKMRAKVEGVIRDIIIQGIEDGEIDPAVDSHLVTFAFWGAFNYVPRWYKKDGGSTPEEIGSQFFKIFFHGIAGPKCR